MGRSTRTPDASRSILPLLGLAVALGTACASPGVTPVQQAGATENPEAGPAVRIAEVRDGRAFQDFKGVRFTPTLAGGTDPSRAVGRYTGPNGSPFENVLLDPDLSVESVTAEAVGRALRGAGFRVLEADEPGAGKAVALRITIEKLWVVRRVTRRDRAGAEAEVQVRIAGPIGGLDRGAVIGTRKVVARDAWSRGLWRLALERGLDALTEKAVPELEAAREAAEADAAAPVQPEGS